MGEGIGEQEMELGTDARVRFTKRQRELMSTVGHGPRAATVRRMCNTRRPSAKKSSKRK